MLVWFLAGFVLMRLWHWFIAPLGIMDLTFWHAMGLSLVASFFSSNTRSREERGFDYYDRAWRDGIWRLPITLMIGWLFHLAMSHAR